MLQVATRNDPVRTRWVDRVCGAVRDNNVLRRKFAITNMVSFRAFVRRQGFGEIRAAALAFEAGNVSALLCEWQSHRGHSDEASALPRPAKNSSPPDGQLHLLPFYAGVRGFRL